MTYMNPLAKWQLLAAEYIGEDISRFHYSSAKEYLSEKGVALVFGNTVKAYPGVQAYVAIIEHDHDWVAFVTEAAAAWRENVQRFTLVLKGKPRIEEIMLFGSRWSGGPVTQKEAAELARIAIFVREQGQVVE